MTRLPTYLLVSEEIRRYFEINPETGTLQTAGPLDHEKAAEFLVNVGAATGAATSGTGTLPYRTVGMPRDVLLAPD